MADQPTLHVVNWSTWQSYRSDRGQPPWIKLHRRLLRSRKWARLSDVDRAHLVSIWILAADREGEVPYDPLLIRKFCFLDTEPDLERFIAMGWLEPRGQIDMLASTGRQEDAKMSHQKQRQRRGEEEERKNTDGQIFEEAVSIYNEMAGRIGLSRVQKLTPTRQKHLRARLEDCGGLDGWRTACAKVEASSFLRGEESDRGWKANFDFMMRQSRFTSLMEGQYDRPAGRRGSSKESPSERFERMKREGKL